MVSTVIYLHCVSHDPHIQSGEVGRWTTDIPQIRADIKNRGHIVSNMKALIADDGWPEYEGRRGAMYWFLYAHPNCDLEIWDEYGQQYSMEDTVGEKPIARNTVLGKIVSVQEMPEGMTVVFGDLTPEGKRIIQVIQNS